MKILMITALYHKITKKAVQRLRPEFGKDHVKMFYQIQAMKNEAVKVQDKKEMSFMKIMRIQFRVNKFCQILLKKHSQRRKRRTTTSLTSFQQADLAITKNERSVISRLLQELLNKAETIRGNIRIAKKSLKNLPDPTIAYSDLVGRIDRGDQRYFNIQDGSLLIKEKSTSSDSLFKLKFVDIQMVIVLSGANSIGFSCLGEAWMLQAQGGEDNLRLWAAGLLLLTEEAAKQNQAPTFPKFDVIESLEFAQEDFKKDEATYDYLPFMFKKVRTFTMKAFDTSSLNIEDTNEKKRERSVEVLSDDE
jgi:hypothetical protein